MRMVTKSHTARLVTVKSKCLTFQPCTAKRISDTEVRLMDLLQDKVYLLPDNMILIRETYKDENVLTVRNIYNPEALGGS